MAAPPLPLLPPLSRWGPGEPFPAVGTPSLSELQMMRGNIAPAKAGCSVRMANVLQQVDQVGCTASLC